MPGRAMMKTNQPDQMKPGESSTPDARSTASYALLLFVGLVSLYLVIINVVGKIGLNSFGTTIMVIVVPVVVFVAAGFSSRISGPGGLGGLIQFQKAEGAFEDVQIGMAAGSEWLSLLMITGIIAAFTTTNHDGLAMISGIFFGLALGGIYFLPKFANSNSLSVAGVICDRNKDTKTCDNILQRGLGLIIIFCAFAFLIAQIGAGAQILKFHFPLSSNWAAIILVTPVLLTLLGGGMRSVTFANMLLFTIITAAVVVPTIWLSQRITGNPVPQLSFGTGALQPILELEGQLAESITGKTRTIFEQGNFSKLHSPVDFLLTFFVMAAGAAALPLLFGRAISSPTRAGRTRTTGWTLLFVAAILSFIPPFVIFMKFEIFRDLVGLPVNQLGQNAQWLYNWASFEGGHHALVCGKSATDIEAIISACRDGANHVLLPSDLQFSPLMTFLGAGEIANMPPVLSALAYAGILSAAATTIAISLMVIANVFISEIVLASGSQKNKFGGVPIAKGLALLRFSLIIASAVGIWVSQSVAVPVTDFVLWGFAISAGVLFPIMLVKALWPNVSVSGLIGGLLSGTIVTIYLLVTIEYGADWVAQNGDEPIWLLPWDKSPLQPVESSIAGFVVAIAAILIISSIENKVRQMREKS